MTAVSGGQRVVSTLSSQSHVRNPGCEAVNEGITADSSMRTRWGRRSQARALINVGPRAYWGRPRFAYRMSLRGANSAHARAPKAFPDPPVSTARLAMLRVLLKPLQRFERFVRSPLRRPTHSGRAELPTFELPRSGQWA